MEFIPDSDSWTAEDMLGYLEEIEESWGALQGIQDRIPGNPDSMDGIVRDQWSLPGQRPK